MSDRHRQAVTKIRDWKGLLHDKPRKIKIQVFAALLILAGSMCFTQFGFVGIGYNGRYFSYMLGLLAPVAITTLLLGKGAGTLFGLMSGAILYAHARLQPLDLCERFLISIPNSVGLYTACGFMLGLLFAVALHNNPQGRRRSGYIALACLVASHVVVGLFYLNAMQIIAASSAATSEQVGDTQTLSVEWKGAVEAVGGVMVAIPIDFVLMLAVCLIADHVVRRQIQGSGTISVRTSFRTNLFVVLALVFAVTQALIFVAITIQTKQAAWEHMQGELSYLDDQLDRSLQLTLGIYDAWESHEDMADTFERLEKIAEPEGILNGYNLTDGTIVVFDEDTVGFSYNPAFPTNARVEELFDTWRSGTLEELSHADGPVEMVYRTTADDSGSFMESELGYMSVTKFEMFYLMMAMPFSLVYADRLTAMTWATALAFVLLATVYVVAARLLGRSVMTPIDRTNASLAQITAGNLDVVVTEHESVEFASLSDGINETVGTLKMLITEAERRNEKDLATARAIQESSLPRTFPPFPEVTAFDIFASMNAAKEVGGDFFDYFLIDEHTLVFLIADVSGKGIPGALFMMSAKTELENYLSTGMAPAEAISQTNRALCANNDAGMFVTVWAATLDWETGLLTYVNAGHNFPLLRRGHGGCWEWLKKRCGLFLGTYETAKYRQETLTLEPGDELVLYTDGVNEAFNVDEEEYGNDRLEAFLAEHADLHPRRLVRSLRGSISQWAYGAEQSDDVTILALEYGVKPESTYSLTVPATLDHLAEVTACVQSELEQRQCPMGVQYTISVALEELFVNACQHAYAETEGSGSLQITFSISTGPSSITVELRDTGIPFNPLQHDEPELPSSLQEVQIGGLGIYYVKESMDEFTYTRNGDANVVTFSKAW